jgi:hypothetical protein
MPNPMQANYARLFTDEQGVSRFEDLAVQLQPGFSPPGMRTTVLSAPFLTSEGSFWVGVPTTWLDDSPHPSPRRMIFVTVRGEYQITASDGSARRFPAGAVLVAEDTTGAGHSTKLIGAEDVIIFAVNLPENTIGREALR